MLANVVAIGFLIALVLARSVEGLKSSHSSFKRVNVITQATATISSSNFDLSSYIAEKKVKVEEALDRALPYKHLNSNKLIDSMRYSLLAGGKRIRPVLCLATCEMFGGDENSAMPSAVAVEMAHTMSLIHDDLPSMDDDNTRRGKPTNHVVYGEDIAILAGDALLSTAFEHIAKETKNVPADRIIEVVRRLGASLGPAGVAGGQVMDLLCENKEGVLIRDLEWTHLHKTAALLKASVAAGAIVAGASEKDISICEEFAEKIGLAFQIEDDILDVTSTKEILGKTAGKDVDSNKTTYVKLLGLESSKTEATRMITEAKALLDSYGDRATPLKGIADFIVLRKS